MLRDRRGLDPRLGERGVALPLALLGLVGVSLIVTTALLTSSTEYAISSAHQDATRALYIAEGGLQAYVAEYGSALAPGVSGTVDYTPAGGTSADAVTVTPVHLGNQLLANDTLLRVFSLTAHPVSGGGRTVAALVKQILPPPDPLSLNITSAMAVAGDLNVNGNAFSVDGRSKACGSAGVEALRYSSDSQLSFSGKEDQRIDNFHGTTDDGTETSGSAVMENSGLSHTDLVSDVLDGTSINSIASRVPTTSWRHRSTSPTYSDEWLETALPSTTGGVAVVDAEGGSIRVGPGSYKGILVVVNGSVELSGSVVFEGIVLVEKNFSLSGNVTLNGALISLAMDGENVVLDTTDDSSAGNGSIEVNYDKCKVDDALESFANGTPNSKTPIVRASFAWMEVVR
jgi:hypothetical protein